MKLNPYINLSTVTPLEEMTGDSAEDTDLLKNMAASAVSYVKQFDWCLAVAETLFGFGIGGVVAVFLVRIVPAIEQVDDVVWVVVGDLPSAYIVADDSSTPMAALSAYIAEIRRWIRAAASGESVADLIPVHQDPTPAMAIALQNRMDFLEREVLAPHPQLV